MPVCHLRSGHRGEELRNHVLIAPSGWGPGHRFLRATFAPDEHTALLGDVQRFRGRSYLADGAIRENDLTSDGRHLQPVDNESWHLVIRDENGGIVGCARYHSAPVPRFASTAAAKSALAQSPLWRPKVERVVENAICLARQRGALFAELGGWCVADAARNTRHALNSVLYMFALGELLGGTIGLSTATTRHASSSILQRLGAKKASLRGESLPSYYDPRFACEMELLQFDSRMPAPRYAQRVTGLRSLIMAEMPVVCSAGPQSAAAASLTSLLNALSPVPAGNAPLVTLET